MPNLERANEFNVALSRFFSTLATVKRAVPASVAATGPAPEMVSCGEDDVSARVVIVILFATGPMRILEQLPDFADHCLGIFLFVHKLRHSPQTKPAQARRLEMACSNSP
jgi:hypothetical protein